MNNGPPMNPNLLRELKIREQQCLEEIQAIRLLLRSDEGDFKPISKNQKYKDIRRDRGITLVELSKRSGVCVSTISAFERGENIRGENMNKILRSLNTKKRF